jgi:hypothetical protein
VAKSPSPTTVAATGPGVPPTLVAEWAGHSVAVLLRTYAKCISGQEEHARQRIIEALS